MKILIALPVYNEEKILRRNAEILFDFCKNNFTDDWEIVIADNCSTDQTPAIARSLCDQFSAVKYLAIPEKGKGIAIKTAWQSFKADIYCFMDADLAVDLKSLPVLIKAIKQGADIAVGSRYHQQSAVRRTFLRKLFSLGYRLAVKLVLNSKINDLPCGFKAINEKVKIDILPNIKDEKWFFDSELVLLAESQGCKISEIPVSWEDLREGKDHSRVNPVALSYSYLKKIIRLKKRLNKI